MSNGSHIWKTTKNVFWISILIFDVVFVLGIVIFGIHDLIKYNREWKQECRENLALVATIQARGLALFDKLDSDHDGLLHEEELRNAVKERKFTGQDKQVVEFLYKYCHSIGHKVGEYHAGKYTYRIYGISRVDLRDLPETAKRLWQQ